MRKVLLIPALLLLAASPLAAWGRVGHILVSQVALKDLPPGVAVWFQGQEATFQEHSSDPDHWKNDRKEGPRHFIDSELYGGPEAVPYEVQGALTQVGAAAFAKGGQVPWIIQDRLRDLIDAFKKGDRAQVVFLATVLGHYIADLHVPLHTSNNHDGQNSGQKGVHSRWETGLVERYASLESLEIQQAKLEPDLFHAPWRWMQAAHALVPKLLEDDRTADRTSPVGARGKVRGEAYWMIFEAQQGGVVKQQLALAGRHLAQMILYAWALAGKPSRA